MPPVVSIKIKLSLVFAGIVTSFSTAAFCSLMKEFALELPSVGHRVPVIRPLEVLPTYLKVADASPPRYKKVSYEFPAIVAPCETVGIEEIG